VQRPRSLLGLLLLVTPILCLIALAWGWWALSLPRATAPPIVYLDVDGREIT